MMEQKKYYINANLWLVKDRDNTIAQGKVCVNGVIEFHVAVRQYQDKETNEEKRFGTFPQRRIEDKDGNVSYADVCFPITAELRFAIQETVFKEVDALEKARRQIPEIGEVLVYPSKKGDALKAFCNVTINDFAVRGIRLMEGKNGCFVSMPSYRNKNGEWQDQIYITDRQVLHRITEACKEEYRKAIHAPESVRNPEEREEEPLSVEWK